MRGGGGGDNRLFERSWERSFNERMIYQLGNRRIGGYQDNP